MNLQTALQTYRGAWWYVRVPGGSWYYFDQRKKHAWTSNQTKARPMSMQRAMELAEEFGAEAVPANESARRAEADKEFVRAVFLAAGRTEP